MGRRAVIRLVIGGDKSGKSAYGLSLLAAGKAPRLLAVTGRALDMAFREQIQAHKRERSPEIPVADCGPDLPRLLAEVRPGMGTVLADSLDFWLFSALEAKDAAAAISGREGLLAALAGYQGDGDPDLVIISTEAGLGPIAPSAAVRAFIRELGALNQAVAAMAAEVTLVVAGLPLRLKGA